MTSFLPILPSHRVGTLAAFMVLTVLATPASAQQKPTVSPADYGRFENLGGATLSPDGRWIAYGVRRVNDETELRVKSLALDSLWTMPWASNPTFSPDGHWLAWTVGVSEDERKRLEKTKERVRNGAGLMNLTTGEERTFEKVASFDFDASGRYLVVHGYAPEEPEGKGADLRVVALEAGTETAFGNVGEYAWSDVGSTVALALATGEAQGNGVQAYDAPTGRLVSLETSESSYAHLAWREDAADLAVLRSVSPAGEDGAAHDALAWRGLDRGQPEHLVLRVAEAGVPDSLELVEHSAPRWSDDGMRIAIGLRPAEPSDDEDAGAESADSAATAKGDQEEELAGLQIWHTSDVRIVPQQQASASRDERRTLLAVWHMDRGSVTQVGTDLLESAELLDGWNLAVESLSAPYPWGAKFGRPYNDVWLVDVASGERERVLERVRYSWESPGGGYLLSFDGEDYWSYDVQSSRRVNLTEGVPATFADTLYDTPTDLLPPHGVGGWLQNDGAVLLYDRFDVWRVSPDGSGAMRLTRGAEEDVVHRVHDLDRDE